jgi:aldose 1-epimerase
MSVELTGGGFRIVIEPALGGAIVAADWHDLPIFAPRDPGLDPLKTGCFVMLPFTNRIADGQFRFEGKEYRLPINNQEENVAIHGFSRDKPWSLTHCTENSVILVQHFAEKGNSYEYWARQGISLSDAGFQMEVSVCNAGERAMPFGIGLHPWFARSPGTKLAFASAGTFEKDARNLPVRPLWQVSAFEPDQPEQLDDLPWLDGCFVGWTSQQARILRTHEKVAIDIEATGALRHLHVFVPDNRNVFCAEPVSHVPDAVNRPELGQSCAMDVLAPGAVLSGAMTLRASPYSPV